MLSIAGLMLLLPLQLADRSGVSNHMDPPAIAPSSDWDRFRGPDGNGIAPSGYALSAAVDPAVNLGWKAAIPPGHSSPIVVGELVFITAFEPQKLMTICLDRNDGHIHWRREIEVSPFERCHPQHGPASSTAASDGERVFAVFGSYGILAYDLAGNELWRKERVPHSNLFGSASSPVSIDGWLIVHSGTQEESLLEAIDPATGRVRWERRRPGPASSWSTPVPLRSGDQTGILFYEPYHLRECSLDDGSDWWSVPAAGRRTDHHTSNRGRLHHYHFV